MSENKTYIAYEYNHLEEAHHIIYAGNNLKLALDRMELFHLAHGHEAYYKIKLETWIDNRCCGCRSSSEIFGTAPEPLLNPRPTIDFYHEMGRSHLRKHCEELRRRDTTNAYTID